MRGSRKKISREWSDGKLCLPGVVRSLFVKLGFFFGGGGAILQCKRKFEISRTEEVGWSPDPPPPPNPSSRSAYVNMEI